eukprot:3656661-Pyramimonas_sp.AAC.1
MKGSAPLPHLHAWAAMAEHTSTMHHATVALHPDICERVHGVSGKDVLRNPTEGSGTLPALVRTGDGCKTHSPYIMRRLHYPQTFAKECT